MLRSVTILSTLLFTYGCSSTGKVTDPAVSGGTDSGDPTESDVNRRPVIPAERVFAN